MRRPLEPRLRHKAEASSFLSARRWRLPPQQRVRVPFVHEDFSEVPAIEHLSAELALHEMVALVAGRLARDLPADLPVLFDYRHGPSSKAGV